MNFQITEEQHSIQAMAQQFAQLELLPHAKEWNAAGYFPTATLRKAATLGLGGIYVRDDLGGTNLTRMDGTLIFEQLATGCISTAAFISIHNMVATIIDRYGNEEQRNRWLPNILTMESLGSYCLTEPSAGSDAASLKTTAVKHNNYYILNGTKAFLSGGETSDIYGGYGYLKEYPIERYFRDLRVHQILEGTNEIMRLIIAKRIFSETFNEF